MILFNEPLQCTSLDEAIGKAYKLSKEIDLNTRFYVIKDLNLGVYLVDENNTIHHHEKLICDYYRGIKTTMP